MIKRVRSIVPVGLLAISGILLGLVPPSFVAALPLPGPGIPAWAPDWMKETSASQAFDPGRARALAQARAFDLIVAYPTEYNRYVPQMMAANAKLRLLAYVNGMFSRSANHPEGWYAHDRLGRRIRSLAFGTYLMYPASPGWRRGVVGLCIGARAASGYHGCFLDSLGPSGLNLGTVTARPIDRSTGALYQRGAWLGDTEGLAASVRRAIAPALLFGNGLSSGGAYLSPKAPTSRLLDGLDGAMDEAWVRQAFDPAGKFRPEASWKKDVDMLVAAASRPSGNIVIVVTKLWVRASPARVTAWRRYALATFLLGSQPGRSYFSFRADYDLTKPSPLLETDLGPPLGPYFANAGAFQRDFTRGTAVVNPTTSRLIVGLGGTYATLSGALVTSVTLGPHTGMILLTP